jgi:hypothetical protein
MIARTPTPPYFAVLFTSRRTGDDPKGYERMARRMVSPSLGRHRWYESFSLRICRVETERLFEGADAWQRTEEHREGQAHG